MLWDELAESAGVTRQWIENGRKQLMLSGLVWNPQHVGASQERLSGTVFVLVETMACLLAGAHGKSVGDANVLIENLLRFVHDHAVERWGATCECHKYPHNKIWLGRSAENVANELERFAGSEDPLPAALRPLLFAAASFIREGETL